MATGVVTAQVEIQFLGKELINSTLHVRGSTINRLRVNLIMQQLMNIINSTCLESNGAEATIEPVYQFIKQPLSPKSIKGYTSNGIIITCKLNFAGALKKALLADDQKC